MKGYEYSIKASMSKLLEDPALTLQEKLDALRHRITAAIPKRDRQEDEELGDDFDSLISDLYDVAMLGDAITMEDFSEVLHDFYSFADTYRVHLAP